MGEKTFEEKPTFKIGETEIECEETVNFLGIEIDYLLTFDTQVSNMCKKVSQQINILKRIGKYLNVESPKAVYHAFIMSTFNFYPLGWHFLFKNKYRKVRKKSFQGIEIHFSRQSLWCLI